MSTTNPGREAQGVIAVQRHMPHLLAGVRNLTIKPRPAGLDPPYAQCGADDEQSHVPLLILES